MTDNQQEYIDYLKRLIRCNNTTVKEANKFMISKIVGKSYGLSEKEMDQAVEETTI